jgi:flagellar biosynthetic protein FliP
MNLKSFKAYFVKLLKLALKPGITSLFLFFLLIDSAHAATQLGDLINLNLEGSISARIMQIIILVSMLSIAPSILIMVTSFTRIAIVLSFVRNAIGLQQSPPNQVLISLALFLTLFIMSPTIEEAYNNGFKPLMEESISEEQAITQIVNPFKKFMLANTRQKDLELFIAIAKLENSKPELLPIKVVIPSFMISELRRAFEIGFLIFLPFLIIDVLVSSILMAMGMMMMPPSLVSLPFKVIFFVLIDGWYMLAGSLVKSFVT